MSVERTLDHDLSQLSRGTRMTRRQLLHRLGFVVGRTLVGLEVQQVLALRRFLASLSEVDAGRIGVLGSRQGGMTALYAAAADENFAGAVIVDYFQQREGCWKEPVDRMLYGQLKEFGDAEVAALIAPRPLSVLHSTGGPTSATSVESELKRARRFFQGLQVAKALSSSELEKPLETAARVAGEILGAGMKASASELAYRASRHQIEDSRSRHFRMLHQYLRDLGQKSDQIRKQYWNLSGAGPDERSQRVEALKGELRTLMGVIGEEGVPLNARSRLIEVNDRFVGYEVLVDVVSGVEAWGHLLIPRAIDGSAPVVIAQHGGGGRPSLVTGIGEKTDNPYHNFGSHLASQGYVVFAPMVVVGNRPFPQARDSEHRVVFSINEVLNPKVRRAAALGMMRTSIEQTKLGRIIDFLDSMPFVDKQHIGYYGLSYGGYSVTWMSALEPRLTASVISGHFNDWRPKITNERIATSYLRHPDEDFSNWNVLHRFTHVELIAATWPRPVCVEYGERDAVTPPGWFRRAWREVQEHARSWDSVDRVVVDYFDGRHEIHAIGAVDFLDRWLKPDRAAAREDAVQEPDRSPSTKDPADVKRLPLSHRLDASGENMIRGTFYVSSSSPVFSGLALKLSRLGNPGDLMIQFGSIPGGRDLGETRIPAVHVPGSTPDWVEGRVTPLRLDPKRLYHFQISAEWGWIDQEDYYLVLGPRPLGGRRFGPNFALFFKTLTSEAGSVR